MTLINRLICLFKGHKWEDSSPFCERCGYNFYFKLAKKDNRYKIINDETANVKPIQ